MGISGAMPTYPRHRPAALVPAVLLLGLLTPSGALAQATRTWVSGVGDDVNPCSRTAPCKTFAGAISKTAARGEIDVLDPGGYGPVTITKPLTIDGKGFVSSVLASGSPGVIINMPSGSLTGKVTLKNLTINGAGSGTNGVRVLSAGAVRIEDVKIFGFGTAGISYEPSGNTGSLIVQDSSIHDVTGVGVFLQPQAGGRARARIRNVSLDDNNDGLRADAAQGRVSVNMSRSSVFDSGQIGGTGIAIAAGGAAGATVRLSENDISGNLLGLSTTSGGSILSFGDNAITGNTVDGVPTGTMARS
jgi:hypothetical protein